MCPLMTYFHTPANYTDNGIANIITISRPTSFDLPKVLGIIWMGGMAVCLLLTLIDVYRVLGIIKKSNKVFIQR